MIEQMSLNVDHRITRIIELTYPYTAECRVIRRQIEGKRRLREARLREELDSLDEAEKLFRIEQLENELLR